jgi:hypothetical protein
MVTLVNIIESVVSMFRVKKVDRLLNPSNVKLSKEAQEVALQRFKVLEKSIKDYVKRYKK